MTATMQATDRQVWSGMLEHLRVHKHDLCRQWFEEIEPLGIAAGQLRLRAHSNVHRDYLRRECVESFNDAAGSVSGCLLAVQFYGPDDEVERAPDEPSLPAANGFVEPSLRRGGPGGRSAPETTRAPRPAVSWPLTSGPKSRFDQLTLNPDYAFDNFVRGPNSQLAHAAALGVAANPGRAYNPYFVHGGVGLGKTHLLQAICLKVQTEAPDSRIHYTSCEAFMTQFIDAVQEGEMTAFRHRFRDVDMLVIDDIHFLAKRDRTQEEFFHTFNSLYQAHKQIVLSSDAAPEDIPDLEDRLVSRFKWGLVTEVSPPDYETRIEIVKQKARLRGLSLPTDVAAHVAARLDTNIRELEGAVVKLQAVASMEKRPIDLALAAAALGDNPQKADKQVQIQSIITAVTDYYGVKITDLQSKRRQRSIALPRQVCMFLARRHTRFSLEEIGGYFGGRDHTTVMHAVKTVEGRCDVDTDFAKAMSTLEGQLKLQNVV
ncbi:MAG: chromosomal replication initiator protein DnaA [Phycisphaerales bacterium]|nr:chromosomal replication initiator protein DnaA [Phycisphaerales bacterium]